jgi:exosortase family protein XrtF
VANTLYGLYVEYFEPNADPITSVVTRHVALILSVFHDGVTIGSTIRTHIPMFLNDDRIINVFEGCNGVNVMIVYVSFLVAFSGTWKKFLYFLLAGAAIIYVMNLVRVALLFEVALNFPNQLYFFHKFLFTGIIYAVVFVIWYFWIKSVRKNEHRTDSDSE